MDQVDRRVKSIIGNAAAYAYGLRRYDDDVDDEDETGTLELDEDNE